MRCEPAHGRRSDDRPVARLLCVAAAVRLCPTVGRGRTTQLLTRVHNLANPCRFRMAARLLDLMAARAR